MQEIVDLLKTKYLAKKYYEYFEFGEVMKKEKIVLIGGGGHCISVIDVIEQENRFQIAGIVDKKKFIGDRVLGHKVIGCDADLEIIFEVCKNAIVTIGYVNSNELRVKLFSSLKEMGFALPTIMSPFAYVSKYSDIGEGTIVMHHALVNSNAKIGKNCIINSKSLIEHDAIVEDNCHISTGAVVNGGTIIKANTFFGSNSTSNQLTQCKGFIKAGSVIK